MTAALRLLVVAAVLVLLARTVPLAWRNRRLAFTVWRAVRPRHVLGSLALLAAVLATAVGLMWFVPGTQYGIGSLVGLSGNAVFAPLEEAIALGGGPPAVGAAGIHAAEPTAVTPGAPRRPEPWVAAAALGFLGGLVLLLPWLAYVEERVFREGLEHAGAGRQAWVALKFGLLHLVMLIPLAAALAIAVAGFAYGRVYRRAYRRAAGRAETIPGPLGTPLASEPSPAGCRRAAILESTVWHATFNSVVVLLVTAGLVGQWAFGL